MSSALWPEATALKQPLEDGIGNRAHELADLRGGKDRAVLLDRRRGNRLVHDGERVAHRAVSCLGQQGKGRIFSVDFFFDGDHLQLGENVVELDCVKAEVLAARTDRLRNVLRFRRGHHEDDVRRRLFQCFQQGIEGCFSDLMRLIEDVNLVAVARGRVAGGVTQFANLINAAICGPRRSR